MGLKTGFETFIFAVFMTVHAKTGAKCFIYLTVIVYNLVEHEIT